jgi:hypothetical protein
MFIKENDMGTGGVKLWAKEAFEIAERINNAFQVLDFELGDGKNVPKFRQISAGKFALNIFGKEWLISISPKGE